jgi:hypothetical protein
MKIRLLDRSEAETLDRDAWQSLADHSVTPNPFYEPWCLLPALRHLHPGHTVLVAAVYIRQRLVALFPICLTKKGPGLRLLRLWRFQDCLLTDVLCDVEQTFPEIAEALMRKLDAQVWVSSTHTTHGFSVGDPRNYFRIVRPRKAITEKYGWNRYLELQPRKVRKENRRVMSRLLEREGVRYVTGDRGLRSRWFPLYADLENRSWKGIEGSAICRDNDRYAFYRDVMQLGEPLKKIEFQAISIGEDMAAMSFRYTAQRNAYEIKTSYCPDYRNLYPGVVLELLNIKGLLESDIEVADSCAPSNSVVERIWPNEIPIYRTTFFGNSVKSRFYSAALKGYRKIRPWHKHRQS